MVKMNDIYMVVDSLLLSRNYWNLENSDKLEQIDLVLRLYLAYKLNEIEPKKNVTVEKLASMPAYGLIKMLEYHIPPEERIESLAHIIHYMLNIASKLQGSTVVWYESDEDKYRWFPEVTFNEAGMWDTLISNKNASYVEIYNTANSALQRIITRKR